jgi:hypothetical protein
MISVQSKKHHNQQKLLVSNIPYSSVFCVFLVILHKSIQRKFTILHKEKEQMLFFDVILTIK